jgi:hypothetical protein
VNIPQRLRALSADISTLQTDIGILEEQIAFQTEVADDAGIRAVVSETPLADREAQEASGDLALLMRSRQEALKRLQQLRDEQDSLLERLLEDDGNR